MSEEIVVKPPVTEEITEPTVNVEDKIGDGFWGEQKIVNNEPPVVTIPPVDTPPVTPVVEENTIPIDWLKKEFDIEDPAVLKAEREELKKLKETSKTAAEIEFSDDQSKQIHELLRAGKKKEVKEFLQAQDEIESLTSVEVNNDNAEAIIKLQMKLKNKQLTDKEIDFEYRQNYVAPKEPVQRITEDDTEFEERMAEYKEKCENIEIKKGIAAKLAQPELAKLKSEIVLPEITPKEVQPNQQQLSQEDLDKLKKEQEVFINSVETGLKTFNDLSITVKDEAVEIPIAYTFSAEEKSKLSEQFKTFAESGFDANAILAPRWVNEDGTMNVARMVRDMARLNSDDRIDQKIANDSAAKRLKEYTKDKKQIHLPGVAPAQNGQIDPNKALEAVEESIWSR